MRISELTPTESRLLLTPHKLNGRDLVISSIKDLLFLKHLSLSEIKIKSRRVLIINFGERAINNKRAYYQLISDCIENHYKHYPEPIDEESSLTPERLIRNVYGSLDFDYQKFKRKYLYKPLRKNELFRAYFPFHILRLTHTKKGKALKSKIETYVEELEKYYKYYAETDRNKLKELIKELGANILLAYNIEVIMKELNILRTHDIHFKQDLMLNEIVFLDFLEYGISEINLSLFDFSGFEFPNISFGDIFDFN